MENDQDQCSAYMARSQLRLTGLWLKKFILGSNGDKPAISVIIMLRLQVHLLKRRKP